MKTLEEVLEAIDRDINKKALEQFIARNWIRPQRKKSAWVFEDIDIARLELICHLTEDIEVNEEGMDVVLSLLDQLYGMRTHMKHITHAISRQPRTVQVEIRSVINQLAKTSG